MSKSRKHLNVVHLYAPYFTGGRSPHCDGASADGTMTFCGHIRDKTTVHIKEVTCVACRLNLGLAPYTLKRYIVPK